LAKLWIAGRAAHRAVLEAKTNLHPITLPETTYLTLTLGQMSDQELRGKNQLYLRGSPHPDGGVFTKITCEPEGKTKMSAASAR
jgi:hypothetical protein